MVQRSRNPWRVRKVLAVLARVVRLVSWLSAHMRDAIERTATDDEKLWVLQTADILEEIAKTLRTVQSVGESVATGQEDPRETRRARKRPVEDETHPDTWMRKLYGP
jgi:hypothetical protein